MNVWQVTVFMLVVIGGFIGLDIYLAVDDHNGNTYSEILRAFGKRHAWFPLSVCFLLGLLAGHWWW